MTHSEKHTQMNVNINILDELCSVKQIKMSPLKHMHLIWIIKQDMIR